MYRFRIKESKFPLMEESNRYLMSGITQEMIDKGEPNAELEELGLALTDVEMVADVPNVNRQSREYLASTDWYVTRQAETGVEVPADVATKRAEARAAVVD